MIANDERTRSLAAQRDELHKIPSKTKTTGEMATRQYLLAVALMYSGPNCVDEFVEGLELMRRAHENRNGFATDYLRRLAKNAPKAFDVVSEINGERHKLIDSLADF